MIYKILDYIIQKSCSHDKKWQLEQEISRKKSGSPNFTCSYEWEVQYEVHCFRCGKKWNGTRHE